MPTFKLPDLGEGLPDAQIREWFVKEGDSVAIDQLIASMETAKSLVEIPAPFAGIIDKLYGQPGDTIETGSPLVDFADAEGTPSTTQAREDSGTVVGHLETSDTVIEESATGITTTSAHRSTAPKAMPAVRNLAKKLGVDLTTVTATGPNGTITADDVKSATPSTTQAIDISTSKTKMSGVRAAMADHMSQIHQQVVPATLCEDADIHAWAEGHNNASVRLLQALCAACKTVPMMNTHFDAYSQSIQSFDCVHAGIAVNTEKGLFVPVISDCEQKSASELRDALNTLKQQAKDLTLDKGNIGKATIVLSNVGSLAGRYAVPVVPKPSVAIIAAGRTRDEVVAFEGKPAVHPVMPLSITFDHRVITGGEAALFLKAFIEHLVKDQA